MKLKGIELKGTYKVIYYATLYDEKGNVIYENSGKGNMMKKGNDLP